MQVIEMDEIVQDPGDDIEPSAPLIQDEHLAPSEPVGTSNKLFIWSLTLSAGVSGLLFGYEYVAVHVA